MVTQSMYVYLHFYFRFIKFWDLELVSFEIKGYSRASEHSNGLDTTINGARKPNHTALIILNASNTDLYNYVTVELTSSANESVAGQYAGVGWCPRWLPDAVKAAHTCWAQLYLERLELKRLGRQPARGLVDF